MNEQIRKKERLKRQIKEILDKNVQKDIGKMGLDELVAEVSIYHQELEYQNEELMRTQKQLEDTRAGYQSLFDDAPLGYVICDEALKIINANKTFCKMVQNNNTKNIALTDFITPGAQDKFYLYFRKLVVQNECSNIEIELKSNSYVVPVIVDGNQYIEGENILYRFTFSDITFRKQTEQELIKSETKFRQLVTQMEQGLAVHEAIYGEDGKMVDYRFIEMNESFEEITRLRREDILGKTILEVLPKTERYWIEAYSEVVKTGKSLHYENYSNELGKYFEAIAYRNSLNQFAVIVSDITKRKETEISLRESEERFSIAFKSSPAPLVISDIETGLFVDVNNRWVEMLGYSKEFMIGKTSKEVGIWMNPTERDRIVKLLKDNGSFKDQYIEFKTKSSELILALWSAEAIVISGRKMMLSMINDITKQKKVEFELQRFNLNWELLTKAIGQINSVLELETVMRQLVDSAIMITGAKEGTAGMVVDGKMVFKEYNRQGKTFPIKYSFDLNVGVPGWVMASKKPYISNNAEEDEHVKPEVQKALGFKNLVDIPVLDKHGKVIGCFEIHNKPGGFNEHDVTLLQNLAANAAVAIENSEEILQRKKAQEALRELANELEDKVNEKTRELQERVELLERFHDATIDREFRIKELRKEIEQLKSTNRTGIKKS
ncbi:MAG: PAS domain S-box protein [Prolixibacteraceae bacterium]|nr:PAS domain S-box protein [Prolixibacteraceae bacterium]